MTTIFHGVAREAAGSYFLVETGAARFLVDCGMIRGGREAPARNRAPFTFDPRPIDFVLLTHAHIDCSVPLPKLARMGLSSPIHATAATADLLHVMMPVSGHIQETNAACAQRRVVDFDYLVEEGFSAPQDVQLFVRVDVAEDIVAVLEAFDGGTPPGGPGAVPG